MNEIVTTQLWKSNSTMQRIVHCKNDEPYHIFYDIGYYYSYGDTGLTDGMGSNLLNKYDIELTLD